MSAKAVLRCRLCAAIGLAVSLPVFSQVPAVRSGAAAAIEIDGQTGDWSGSSFILDAKSGAEFAVQNNGQDLYILLVLRKPETRVSLKSTGITVLARAPGAKTSRGVLFLERAVPAETYIRWKENQGELMIEEEKAKLRETARHDLCFAFAVGAGGSTYGPLRRLIDSEPPVGAVSEGAAETVCELRIPLQPPDRVPGGLGASPGETIRVSFEWGGASRKFLSPKTTVEPSALEQMGDVSGSGVTWAQEFLDAFDSMSRPTRGTKKFSFAVDLRLSEMSPNPNS